MCSTTQKFVVSISIGIYILQYAIYFQKMFIPDVANTFEYRKQYLSMMQNATTQTIRSQRHRQSPPANITTTLTVSPALSTTMSQFKKVALMIKRTQQKPFQRKYVNNLSHFQTDDIIRQVKVKNLTSVRAKRQFIYCAVYALVRRKGASLDHVCVSR